MNSETKTTILIMLTTGYILSPAALWFWLNYQFEAGAFPVHADSIGIPMAGFLFLWFVGWVAMIILSIGMAIYRQAFGANLS
jgi:hypothetical protein